MKKAKLVSKILIPVLIFTVLAASMAACGRGNDNRLVGTWDHILTDEQVLQMRLLGITMRTVKEFSRDGNFTMAMHFAIPGIGEEVNTAYGTWETNGNELILTAEDETTVFTYSINGGILALTLDGETAEFERR